MTTIKRFTPDYKMHAARFEPFARETEHGELVKLSDYEALVSELASSRQINAQTLQVKLTMAETIKGLTDRVNALAVENAALKARSIKLFNLGYLRGHESTVDGYFVDVHWCDIDTYHDDVVAEIIEDEGETSATDAALAAIQAQGVEKFADDLHRTAMALCPVKPDNTTTGAYAGLARSFAKKLREAK
ncbi:TPA: hypothetical protein JS159_002065 [Serratia marcescens]|nr:hypothetical protein [Serratia marcescens]